MSISVIVSNFNGERFLTKLLDSLYAQKKVNIEIIIVDRNSTDSSLEVLKKYSEVKIIQEPPETGNVSGYTKGIQLAQKDKFFFCNEDLYLDENCLYYLESSIDLKKKICAADPWQWTYDGKHLIHGATYFEKVIWAIESSYGFRYYNFISQPQEGNVIPFACAGAFLIDKNIFFEAGGWDTSFFMSNEDVDLFTRIWQRDLICISVPQAKVYHAVGATDNYVVNKMTVKKRRYISLYSSTSLIPVKYFSLKYVWLAFLSYFVRFIRNLVKFRFRMLYWDLLVLQDFFSNLPHCMKFRSKNSKWNKKKPGQLFFTYHKFQKQKH